MANKVTKITPKEAKTLFSKEIPKYIRYAAANTLTKAAFQGMRYSEIWLKNNWVNRNKFLLGAGTGKGAIKYNKAKVEHDLNNISSAFGSPKSIGSKNFEFLADQEEGFTAKGSIPTKKARVSKNYNKVIARKHKRKSSNIENLRGQFSKRMTVIHLRRLFEKDFALPGSDKFIFMKDNQLGNYGAGLYQFARKTKPNKLSNSGSKLQFPNLKKMYTSGKDNNQKREASHWMKKSRNMLKQPEIDRFFDKAADQAFAGQLKLWKN